MNAEKLRTAASLMREQHGPEHQRHEMWSAMADWLDAMASRAESKLARGGNEGAVWAHEMHALAVADAYLRGAA